ncbi:MAG: hypothetical protein PHS59_16885 [Paludibacter sp.]|nr:hypothetical protein [Paludibacter sp.]
MKKFFFFVGLFLAVSSVYAQTFVPTAGVKYNLKHVASGFVVGLKAGDAVYSRIVTLDNSASQAWEFIPVAGETDVYNIKNAANKYLNNIAGNKWDVTPEAALNGDKSKWLLTGTAATSIRLQNLNPASGYPTTAYLGRGAGDANTVEGQVYCDKDLNVNSEFSLEVAAVAAQFSIASGSLVTEVEDGLGVASPLYISASGQTYDIQLTLNGGYTATKTTFVPADFASGVVKIDISQGTSVLDGTGTAVFSYNDGTEHTIATANIATIAPYTRYYIKNNTDPTLNLVIGNEASNLYPALTVKSGASTQKFFFRRVNILTESAIDTLNIVQDGTYKLIRKDPTSGWNTDFGIPANEAKWTKEDKGDGIFSITNVITGLQLGSDAPAADGRLYDNKVYPANNTAWLIQDVASDGTGLNQLSSSVKILVANGKLSVTSVDSYTVYSVQGIKVADVKVNTSNTQVNLMSGVYVVVSADNVQKVIVK